MPTFIVTTSAEEVQSMHPDVQPVFESGEFKVFAIEKPEIALRQWETTEDVVRRDLAAGFEDAVRKAQARIADGA